MDQNPRMTPRQSALVSKAITTTTERESSTQARPKVARPPPPKTYPWGEDPSFPDHGMGRAFLKFRDKYQVQVPFNFDIPILREMGLYDRARALFARRGHGFVFEKRPVVYSEITKEFMASFEVESEQDAEEVYTKYIWKFRLGSKPFSIKGTKAIKKVLMIADGERSGNELSTAEFWSMITGGRHFYKGNRHESKDITDPWWKLVHYIIATNVYMRTDNGRYVNLQDLMLMNHLNGTDDVDLVDDMAEHLLSHRHSSHKRLSLGGGNVATLVAEHVGFILDPAQGMEDGLVQQGALTKKGIIKKVKGQGWMVCEPKAPEAEKAQENEEESEEEEDPITREDLRTLRRRLGRIERQTAVNTARVRENTERLKWQEGVMMSMITHFQIPGVEPFHYEPEQEQAQDEDAAPQDPSP